MLNISTATTAELVAFYNKHADKPVTKFADRKTAERRVAALMNAMVTKPLTPAAQRAIDQHVANGEFEALRVLVAKTSNPAQRAYAMEALKAETTSAHELRCPICGDTENLTCGEVKILRGMQHVVNEHIADCHSCGHEWNTMTGKPVRKAATNPERGAAIAASWKNKKVAAARAQRHGVVVRTPDGKTAQHKSVREAFMVLALPLGQHIKFRGALKAAGKAEFGGFKFKLA